VPARYFSSQEVNELPVKILGRVVYVKTIFWSKKDQTSFFVYFCNVNVIISMLLDSLSFSF
jgi:hypothetical protein